MAEILRWEPMTLLGRPVPDTQQAVLDDPRGVQVTVQQNGYQAWHAVIRILDPDRDADVMVSWPNAEPDHSIPESEVKAWATRFLPGLAEMFGDVKSHPGGTPCEP